MKQRIILLFANQYSMKDDDTGEIKEGITSNYYFNTDLSATANDNGSVGTRPAKGAIPLTCLSKIQSAPALYDAQFDMKIGSDGKPVLTIVDLDFVEEIRMVPKSVIDKSMGVEKSGKVG